MPYHLIDNQKNNLLYINMVHIFQSNLANSNTINDLQSQIVECCDRIDELADPALESPVQGSEVDDPLIEDRLSRMVKCGSGGGFYAVWDKASGILFQDDPLFKMGNDTFTLQYGYNLNPGGGDISQFIFRGNMPNTTQVHNQFQFNDTDTASFGRLWAGVKVEFKPMSNGKIRIYAWTETFNDDLNEYPAYGGELVLERDCVLGGEEVVFLKTTSISEPPNAWQADYTTDELELNDYTNFPNTKHGVAVDRQIFI